MDYSNIVIIVKVIDGNIASVGTGFLVGKSGFLLTCYHVTRNVGCCNVGNTIGFIFEGKTNVLTARLEAFDPELDVAILHTEGITDKHQGYQISTCFNEGEKFNTRGYPKGSIDGEAAHPVCEGISPTGFIELKKSNDMCKGFSGAPLLNQNGFAVAMIRFVPETIRKSGSLLESARAIPMETIIQNFPQIASDELMDVLDSKKTLEFSKSHTPPVKGDLSWQSSEFDDLAGQTFFELMQIWLDKTGVAKPSRLTSGSQMFDYVVELPSLLRGMSTIRTFWQIKSSSMKFSSHYDIVHSSNCFYLELSGETITSLKESMQLNDHFYLAFAHNPFNETLYDLRRRAPQERFEWYCVDFNQQFKNNETYIIIPEQNKLNLSTFSLLWSSLWVEKAYSPLSSHMVYETPGLHEVVRQVFPKNGEHIVNIENWESLSKKVQAFESEIGKDELSKINLPLAIGALLGDITNTLYVKSTVLDTIQTYCPESLYGNANFWLFDKSYHKFMYASGQVVNPDRFGNNLRILPLPDKPEKISDLVKACLWHIMLLYSALNVEVRIIYCPSNEAGIDHSYYGGGIDYFPWLSISDDGITFMIEKSADATKGLHQDFINQYMNDIFISPKNGNNIYTFATQFKLEDPNELKTAPKCPVLLFPKEDRFIDYPKLIFGTSAISSIHSLSQKLL